MACSRERCEAPGPRGGPCNTCRKRRERQLRNEEINARRRDLYRENPEPVRAAVQAWRSQHLDQERARGRERGARYRVAHHEQSREAVRSANARWKAEHPVEWSLLNRESVRRRKLGFSEPVDYSEVLARDGMTCHICGEPISELADCEFDHVIPVVLGGTHTADNIRPSHVACNRRKGGRSITE